ncbi:MAG: hypothetical protein M3143_02505 [Actinomycetota bacterium]|nr:hypothetical protein [Actinomycetota bacterium]
MKWGLSVLDCRDHAIDERRDHPIGVFKAECGHLLMMVTALRAAPSGTQCEACTAVAGPGHPLRDLAHQDEK